MHEWVAIWKNARQETKAKMSKLIFKDKKQSLFK
jgi:hypothetical protein